MRIDQAFRPVAALGLVAVALAGCGKSEGTDPGPTENPAIAISISKTALSIVQGGTDNLTASITRSGGFTGTVTVVTEGAPAGVSATVSNVTTSGTTTTGTVTVAVGAAVAPGTYNLTIKASGSGVTEKTAALALTVTAAPAISIALTGSPVTVAPGGSGTVQVAITRTNFTGNVALTLEGAPAGVTGSFNPSPATGSSSTLTVQVGAAVAAGTYPLTVRAAGQGLTDATAALSLVVGTPSSFGLSVAPSPVTIAQGGSGNVTVTIARTNFTADVALTLTGAPAGVTGTFTPASTAGTTSTLALAVGAAVAPGTYNLSVKGNSAGQAEQSVALDLTVPVTGNYSLTTTPSGSASVQQGGSANVTVNLVRTGGFTGSVALTVTGAPAGLTVGLTPASTTGNSSTLAVSAASSVAVGSYPLVIKGTATGLADQTVNLTINVTAPSGSGNVSLDYSACTVDDRPVWVAYQDGTAGAWTQVVGNNNVFTFNITQSKAGLAIVTSSGGSNYVTTVQYYAQAEIIALSGLRCTSTNPTGKTVTGTVANLGATQVGSVSLGGAFAAPTPASPNFTLNNVQSGANDLVAFAHDITGGASDRGVIVRDLNPPAGGSVGTIDFTGGSSFAAAAATITVGGTVGGETLTQGMSYKTGSACFQAPLYGGGLVTGSSFTAYGIPASAQRGSDLHAISVSAIDGTTSFRTAIEYFGALTARTVNLPTALPAPTIGTLAGPYKRLQFQYTLPTEYAQTAVVNYIDIAAANAFLMFATAGYLGSQAVNLSAPDFSGVSGWSNTWAPGSSATVTWTTSGAGSTLTTGCTAGGRIVSGTRTGTI